MPLDPSIILRGIPPPTPVQSPLEALSVLEQLRGRREQAEAQRAATEERRLAGEERRQKAADEAAARQRAAAVEQRVQAALVQDPTTGRPTLDWAKLLEGGEVPSATIFKLGEETDQAAQRLATLESTQQGIEEKNAKIRAIFARPVAVAGYAKPAWDAAVLASFNRKALTAEERDAGFAMTDPAQIKAATDAALVAGDEKPAASGSFEDYVQRVTATSGAPPTPADVLRMRREWETAGRAPAAGEAVGSFSDYVTRRFGANPTPEQITTARTDWQQQGGESGALGDFADYLRRKFGPTPTAAQIEQARKDYALPQQPTYIWAVPPGGTAPELLTPGEVRTAGAERPPEPSTAAQSLAAGYAARIAQAEPTFTKVSEDIRTMSLPAFELQTNSWFAKPTFQSATVQQYMQAARNFINANLRRESGAAISPGEFAEARAQYLPQPGDTDEAKALKAANRTQILANMKNEAGRAYQGPVGAAPANVAAVLKDVAPGRHTLSDGSKWDKRADGSIVKVP